MKRRARQKRRRWYSPEFKAELVRLVREEKKCVAEVAREHDLPRVTLHRWVDDAEDDENTEASVPRATTISPRASLTSSEKDELQQLRREVKRLEMEKEILKKAAVFFAKETR